MNFRFGYGDVMKGFFVLDLPGPTPPDMRLLPFTRIARPVFPLDRDSAARDRRCHVEPTRRRPMKIQDIQVVNLRFDYPGGRGSVTPAGR